MLTFLTGFPQAWPPCFFIPLVIVCTFALASLLPVPFPSWILSFMAQLTPNYVQARTTEKDTASLRLKAALKEIESTASRQFFQIVELEAALARANQDKAIETETRR